MIKLNTTNKNEFVRAIKMVIDNYNSEYEGEITISIKKLPAPTSKLGIWKAFEARATHTPEESDISEWSPNNDSEIGRVMEHNPILRAVTNSWYDYYDKHTSVCMTDLISEELCTFDSIADEYDIPTTNHTSVEDCIEHPENYPEELVKDLDEVLEILYSRNPNFCVDW